MSKWKQIETYEEAIKLREGRFVMTPDQAKMVLDLKKKELQKSKYLSIVDISAAEVKKLAKKDRTIEKVIGKLGGSFRVNLLKSKASEKAGAVGGYRQMKSRTPAQLRALRKQMGIKAWDEEVELEEATFSPAMIDKLRKSYGPMKGKKIVPGPLMKIFDKIDKNKNALIQLYKADIPFVSQMAVSRLISKHNMKGKDINKLREDAPTNFAGAGSGVDFNPTGLSMKKKRELDARTKEYRLHRRKLEAQRERRKLKAQKNICGSFRKNVKENTDNFVREEFIVEDNVAILRDIVKRKQAKPIKLKDGQMKIDLNSANAIIKNLVDAPKNFMKDDTRKKVLNIINKGRKDQFLRLIDMLYK